MIGSFSASVTVPVTVMFWALSSDAPRRNPAATEAKRLSRLLLFIKEMVRKSVGNIG